MKLIHALSLCLVLSAALVAQTSTQLQQKFGKPVEAFAVRPDILMTVEYNADGNPLFLTFEPRHARVGDPTNFSLFPGLSRRDVEVLLTELIPTATRGEKLSSGSFNSGCNSIYTEKFTRVSIKWATGAAGSSCELYSVQVQWRNR